MTADQVIEKGWKATLLAGSVLFAFILVCFWDTWTAMAVIWLRSETYQHGLIVPPITAWLIWRKRHQLTEYSPRATALPALAVLALSLIWVLGELTAVNALTQFAVVGILACGAVALVGKDIGRQLAFPLLFLFFAVPIGDFTMPQLMEWTANFTVIALRATGIPVYREGLQFVIPSGNWSVVEACSGIRYLIASLTVGTLFAYLTYTSLKRRLIFVGISLAVPIVANWIRAYLIVLLGHVSGNKLATGADHLIYGWVFFGIVIAMMFAIGMRWSENAPDLAATLPSESHAANKAERAVHPLWAVALLVALAAAIGPIGYSLLQTASDRGEATLTWPTWQGGWQAADNDLTPWRPAFTGASTELKGTFHNGSQQVGIWVGFYRHQNYQRKLITSTNLLVSYRDKEWQAVDEVRSELSLDGHPLSTRRSDVIQKGETGQRLRVHYWYWINGHTTTSDFAGKWLTAQSMLTGHGDDSAVVAIYAPDTDTESIVRFLEINRPLIEAMLEQAQRKLP